MSSSLAFHSRPRHHHPAPSRGADDDDDTTSSDNGTSTSLDGGAVLLFAPPPSTSLHRNPLQPGEDGDESEWDVLPSFVAASRTAPGGVSSASSDASSGASPAATTRSLFPSHDGNGIFLADSLVLSEAPSIYASAVEVEPPSEDDSVPASSSLSEEEEYSSLSREVKPARRGGLGGFLPREEDAMDVGGSWALTEAALSTIPDAHSSIHLARNGVETQSAGFTSDSSEDESFEGVTPRRRGRGRQPADKDRNDDDEEHEDLMSTTPHAESAGLSSYYRRRRLEKSEELDTTESSRSRDAYPTPPPETPRRLKVKRRHRQSGRSKGSEKRSSTSGSVSRSREVSRRRPVVVEVPSASRATGRAVYVKGLIGELFGVDAKTGELLVGPLPTPAPTRTAAPVNYTASSVRSRARPTSRKEVHGLDALSRHARMEIDGGDGQFNFHLDDFDDDSGDETETDARPYTEFRPSHYDAAPPGTISTLFEEDENPTPLRSQSLTALPRFFKPTPLRRISSFSSSSRQSDASATPTRRTVDSAWGGELEGFEAAISYWRRILSRMRGY